MPVPPSSGVTRGAFVIEISGPEISNYNCGVDISFPDLFREENDPSLTPGAGKISECYLEIATR